MQGYLRKIKSLNFVIWITFKIELENGPDSQFVVKVGIMGQQPIDQKIFLEIFNNKIELKNVQDWYLKSLPIVTSFGFEINS